MCNCNSIFFGEIRNLSHRQFKILKLFFSGSLLSPFLLEHYHRELSRQSVFWPIFSLKIIDRTKWKDGVADVFTLHYIQELLSIKLLSSIISLRFGERALGECNLSPKRFWSWSQHVVELGINVRSDFRDILRQ